MSKSIILFFLFLSLSIMFCEKVTKKPEKTEKKKSKQDTQKIIGKNLNFTNQTSSNSKESSMEPPLNISINEKDTLIFCGIIAQESVRNYEDEIQTIQKRLNLSFANQIYDKIIFEILEKCSKKVDLKEVNKYIKNLTYINDLYWDNKFNEFFKFEPDKYKNLTDIKFTMNQQLLMYKFNKVNEEFNQKREELREKLQKENRKIRIGKIDMENIPFSFKLGIFLVILSIFFGGIYYFLKTLTRKPIDKKKKEKKKKTQ